MWVITSNDDTLTAEDLALGYKQLLRVEQCWRQLKSSIRMRPVFHYRPWRIQAHISISILALLLERIAEIRVGLHRLVRRPAIREARVEPHLTPRVPTTATLVNNYSALSSRGRRETAAWPGNSRRPGAIVSRSLNTCDHAHHHT
jgi:hypothetical protein